MINNFYLLALGFLLAFGQHNRPYNTERLTAEPPNQDRIKSSLSGPENNTLTSSLRHHDKAPGNLKSRPNIILITADDLGLEVGCYGDKFARTPTIDRLAKKGVRFSTAWITQSVCSPSRSSIFTGLYPHQNGQIGLSHLGFQAKETLRLPNLLKTAGYRTGIIGKLHVAPESGYEFDMWVRGNWSNEGEIMNFRKTRDIRKVVREAKPFIEDDSGSPFFLKISYLDPHPPFVDQLDGFPAKVYKEGDVQAMSWVRENKEVADKKAAHFYNCISRLDDGISMLMKVLKQSGKIENTMIIFVSDNGAPFTGGKQSCYDPGLRVPFIVYWKGGSLKAGQVRNEMVSAIDIMPTILEVCGVKIPEELPGRSLLPLLKGEQPSEWRNFLFGEMNFSAPKIYFPMRTVRNNRYHLIHNLDTTTNNYRLIRLDTTNSPEWELFDLFKDPLEHENIAENPLYINQLNQLKKELNKWQVRTNDPLLDPANEKKWHELYEQEREKNRIDPPILIVK